MKDFKGAIEHLNLVQRHQRPRPRDAPLVIAGSQIRAEQPRRR